MIIYSYNRLSNTRYIPHTLNNDFKTKKKNTEIIDDYIDDNIELSRSSSFPYSYMSDLSLDDNKTNNDKNDDNRIVISKRNTKLTKNNHNSHHNHDNIKFSSISPDCCCISFLK